MKKIAVFALALATSISLTPAAQAELTGGTWKFTPESVNLNLGGVSPFVEKVAGGDRIWFASPAALPDPIMVVDCNEAGACTRQTLSSRFGSDATVVTLKDGTRKAFFVEMGPNGKKIKYATVNGNSLSHGVVSDLDVEGASVSAKEMAWGVPDAVVLPDGRVRVYWVLAVQGAANPRLPETLVSATSTDATATKFVRDSGTRLTGGYVDSEILRAVDGDWVMMVSTGPGAGTQSLYMATSTDGLNWNLDKKQISSPDESALDPSGYEISGNEWRVYYVSAEPGMRVDRNYQLKRATLTWSAEVAKPLASASPSASAEAAPATTPSAAPKAVPSAKKLTITCVKGKTTKKLSGANPKCPAGFKKKA